MILVKMTFDLSRAEEIRGRVPAERARVSEMLASGDLSTLYLAKDMTAAWLVLKADSEEEVNSLLRTLPLYEFASVELSPVSGF